jgi:hypothetical protein
MFSKLFNTPPPLPAKKIKLYTYDKDVIIPKEDWEFRNYTEPNHLYVIVQDEKDHIAYLGKYIKTGRSAYDKFETGDALFNDLHLATSVSVESPVLDSTFAVWEDRTKQNEKLHMTDKVTSIEKMNLDSIPYYKINLKKNGSYIIDAQGNVKESVDGVIKPSGGKRIKHRKTRRSIKKSHTRRRNRRITSHK